MPPLGRLWVASGPSSSYQLKGRFRGYSGPSDVAKIVNMKGSFRPIAEIADRV